jgi:DNA sulfur modification protein DndC
MRDITLITHDELSEIRRIWLEEKHEFDDSLPRIYREVTGEPFNDPRPSAERKLLGSDEWTVLEEVCDDDFMHLELMAKLLDTEQQYHAKSRRGIYESLEKCFESSSRSKDEAIQNAHYQRNLKNAIQAVKDDSAELHEIREAFDENSSVSVAERLNKTSAKEDSTQQGKQLTLTGRVWEVSSPGASFIAGKPGNYAPAKQPGHEVTSNEAFAEPDRSAKDWASIKFSAQNSKEENE